MQQICIVAFAALCLLIGADASAQNKKPAKTPPPARAKAKKSRLDPKAVANNELLDKRFLKPYKAGIEALNQNQPDAAIKHAQRAIQLRPNSGRALLVLASAYKVKKLYQSAVQYYRDAIKKFGPKKELYEGAQARYNVAMCFELLSQRTNAIAAWQEYIGYVNTYTMRNSRRDFAFKRIKALQSVKGPPAK